MINLPGDLQIEPFVDDLNNTFVLELKYMPKKSKVALLKGEFNTEQQLFFLLNKHDNRSKIKDVIRKDVDSKPYLQFKEVETLEQELYALEEYLGYKKSKQRINLVDNYNHNKKIKINQLLTKLNHEYLSDNKIREQSGDGVLLRELGKFVLSGIITIKDYKILIKNINTSKGQNMLHSIVYFITMVISESNEDKSKSMDDNYIYRIRELLTNENFIDTISDSTDNGIDILVMLFIRNPGSILEAFGGVKYDILTFIGGLDRYILRDFFSKAYSKGFGHHFNRLFSRINIYNVAVLINEIGVGNTIHLILHVRNKVLELLLSNISSTNKLIKISKKYMKGSTTEKEQLSTLDRMVKFMNKKDCLPRR